MKISASIYSNNDRSLEILIQDLDKYNIDMLHVDFNDKKIEFNKIEEDIKEIRKISNKPIDLHIISDNPNMVKDYLAGKDKLLGFFVGQAMKKTKGKANPKMLNDILKNKLNKEN